MTKIRRRYVGGAVASCRRCDHLLPVLTSSLLTRRRVIDQMRVASATCR
jgi:hypothetical protein